MPEPATTILHWLMANWALSTFVFAALFAATLVGFITAKYVRIMLNVLRDTPMPLLPTARPIGKLHGEDVIFQAFDGVGLRGTWVMADSAVPRRGCVVFCHEFGLDRHSATLYAHALTAEGYDVFSFDFRNHGESARDRSYEPRMWCEQRDVWDALGAFAYVLDRLEEERLPPELGVFGVSRGACAAILASVHSPHIKAMVCDGVFTTDRLWEHYARRWASIFSRVRFVSQTHPPFFWQYLRWCLQRTTQPALNCTYPSVAKAIRRTSPWRPTFFIHGAKDSYIPLDVASELHKLAREPKYVWVAPNARHNQAAVLYPQEYGKRVREFFDRHLAGIAQPIKFRPPSHQPGKAAARA